MAPMIEILRHNRRLGEGQLFRWIFPETIPLDMAALSENPRGSLVRGD